jgi:hypothetical protein
MTKGDAISISPLSTFLIYVALFHYYLKTMFIFPSRSNMQELALLMIKAGYKLTNKLLLQVFYNFVYSQQSANFMVFITINFACTTSTRSTGVWHFRPFLHTDFDCGLFLLSFLRKLGSKWVWLINRGCLLLLGTWSHLLHIQGPCLANSLPCISYMIHETNDCYISHFMSML